LCSEGFFEYFYWEEKTLLPPRFDTF